MSKKNVTKLESQPIINPSNDRDEAEGASNKIVESRDERAKSFSVDDRYDHLEVSKPKYLFSKHPLIDLEEITTSSYAKETIVSDFESRLLNYYLSQSQDLISVPIPAILGLFVSDSANNSLGLNRLYTQSYMHSLVGSALVETILLCKNTQPEENDERHFDVPQVSNIVKKVAFEVLSSRKDITDEVKIDTYNRLFSSTSDMTPWSLAQNDEFDDIHGGENYIYNSFYNYIINTITGRVYVTNAPTMGIIADFIKSQNKLHLANSLNFENITLPNILRLVRDIQKGVYSTDIVGGIKAFQLVTNWLKLMENQDSAIRRLFTIGLYYIQGVDHIPLPFFLVDGTLTYTGGFAEKTPAFIDFESNIGSPIRFKPGSFIDEISKIDIHEIMTFADAMMHQTYSAQGFWEVLDINNWNKRQEEMEQFVDYTTFWRRKFMPEIYTPSAPINVINLVERMARIEMVKRILSGNLVYPPFMVKQQLFYEKTSSESVDYADKILAIIYTMLESVANSAFFLMGVGLGIFKKFGADFSELPQIGTLIKETYSHKMAQSCIQLLRDDTIFINFRKAAADTMPLRIMRIKSGMTIRESYSMDLISRHMTWIDPHTNITLGDTMALDHVTYSEENIYDHIMSNWARYRSKLNRRENYASQYWSLVVIDRNDNKEFIKNIIRQYALAGIIPNMKTKTGMVDVDDVVLFLPEESISKNTVILGVQSEIWGISRDVRYDLISRLIILNNETSYMLEPTMRRIIDMFTKKYIPLLSYSYLASVIGLDLTPISFINKFSGVASVWFKKEAIEFYSKNPTLTAMTDKDGKVISEFKADTAVLLSKPLDDLILFSNTNKYRHIYDLIDRTSTVKLSDNASDGINISFILGDVVERVPLYKMIITRGFVENPIY